MTKLEDQQPVDELDKILYDLMQTIKVTRNPSALGEYAHQLHYNLNDAKARLLQWRARQNAWQIGDEIAWSTATGEIKTGIVQETPDGLIVQASLKDGGTK